MPQNFITSEHDALFKENVRGLLDDLSQKSTFVVVLPATETRCNNCVWDQLHKTSSGKYNGTGPKPFDGKVCPVCLGKGTIKTAKQRKLPAIVAWSKSEKSGNQVPTVAGELPWGYARIKVDIKYLALLEMAEAFVVDSIRCSKVNKIDLAEGTGLLSKVLVNFVVKRAMPNDDDVWFEMDFGDGQYQKIGPETLEKLPGLFEEELQKGLEKIAEKLETNLRTLFREVISERPRKEGKSLRRVIYQGLSHEVGKYADSVDMGVFKLEQVREQTTGPEYGTSNQRSLFDILEEGYGPSDEYGFVGLEQAMDLAMEAIHVSSLSEKQAEVFSRHIQKVFSGRHGDGIVVKLRMPLFYQLPDFGTPLEHGILPHAGWAGWHILDEVDGPDAARISAKEGTPNWILTLLDKAMKQTARRLKNTG